MGIQHENLASDGWSRLSLMEQLGHVGSETSRALNWFHKDQTIYFNSIRRALELIDLTVSDPRWHGRIKEILRARELLVDSTFGDKHYQTSLSDLNQYFFYFALAAAKMK